MAIRVHGPIGARTVSEAADEWLARQPLPPLQARYASALGGELAEVVLVQDGGTRLQMAFCLHQNMLYVLVSGRTDPDGTTAWEAVTRSFAFLPSTVRQTYAGRCPTNDPTTSPHYALGDGYCLLYPNGLDARVVRPGWTELEGPAARLSISIEDPAERRTLDQLVDEIASKHPERTVTREATELGGEPALVVYGLPGASDSRQVFALHAGRVYRAVAEPLDGDAVAPDVEAVWLALLQSWTWLP
jgi:hypothetical protein